MRFFLVAAALAVSLVSAAVRPQAAGRPITLRQATRQQIVRKSHVKGMFRRQELPSNGVYPLCANSGPRTDAVGDGTTAGGVYAVLSTIRVAPNNPNLTPFITDTALDCADLCRTDPTCLASEFNGNAGADQGQCFVYTSYNGGTQGQDGFTTTYNGYTCSNIQPALGTNPTVPCCDLYPAAAPAPNN